jgi:DNA-binding LacI/PurR family transcriptional regulator
MPMKKPPTMRDVAALAGVSPATVSNVLSERKSVDPDMVQRVRKAADELGYQVDRFASQLRSGRTQIVAVLVPAIDNPYFTSLIGALERHARADGYDIIIASSNDTDEGERGRLATLMSWRPAGIVIAPTGDSFAGRDLLNDGRVPYVVLDRVPDDPGADSVTVDNIAAAADAAHHLLALGHRSILVVASSLKLANIRERYHGICDTYEKAGLPRPAVVEGGMTFQSIHERIRPALAAAERPTGIIALTNFATLGVKAALNEMGLAIPSDISLIGFDDYAWMQAGSPPISAVAQPVEALASAAWDRLRASINGEAHAPTRQKLTCRLEIRQSTRAVGSPLTGA